MQNTILPRSFYKRDTPEVAHDLIGKFLVHIINGEKLIGIISETEAYRSDDQASHAFRGKGIANSSLFGQVGHAYTYISYGIHTCLNAVSYDKNNYSAGGTLIRGIIPLKGLDMMKEFRHHRKNIGSGPGNVTQALDISMAYNGVDLTNAEGGLYITAGYDIESHMILTSPRIGISKNKDIHWRYLLNPAEAKNLQEMQK